MFRTYAKWLATLAVLVAVAGLIGLALHRVYQRGYTTAEAIGQPNLSDYQRRQAEAAAQAASAAFGRYAGQVAHNTGIEAGFLGQQSKQAAKVGILKGNIDAATRPPRTERPQTTDAAVDRCEFSADFVRLWNAAAESGAGDRAVPASTSASSATGAAGTDAATCSGVSQADVLDWFIDYTARSHSIEHQLNAVLDAVPDSE